MKRLLATTALMLAMVNLAEASDYTKYAPVIVPQVKEAEAWGIQCTPFNNGAAACASKHMISVHALADNDIRRLKAEKEFCARIKATLDETISKIDKGALIYSRFSYETNPKGKVLVCSFIRNIAGSVSASAESVEKTTSDNGANLGTAAIIQLSETVCETKLTPFMSAIKAELLKEVIPKELMITSAAVINSWKTKSDKDKWCATAAKRLQALETQVPAASKDKCAQMTDKKEQLSCFGQLRTAASDIPVGTSAHANTLDVVVHSRVSQGETCKRLDTSIAYCAPVDTDYISAYVEMPNKNQLKTDADAKASSVANRGSCQEVGDKNYALNRGKKIEVVNVNVVINGDRIVIGCTFRRTEPLESWQKP